MGLLLSRILPAAALLTGLACVGSIEPAAQGAEEIATYLNQRYGFTLSYPTARFRPQEPLSEDGRVWGSHDGKARLLAGAVPTADGMNLRDYRGLVLKQS